MRLGSLLVGLGIAALGPTIAHAAWAPAQRVSPRDSAHYASPDAAVSAGGRALVAWVKSPGDSSPGRVEVAWRPDRAARWSPRRALSGVGAGAPRVDLNDRGDAVVAWITGRSIVAAVRRGDDGSWSVARVVEAGGAVHELRPAIDRTGRPTIMWSESRGDGFLVRMMSRTSTRAGWRPHPAEVATPAPAPPSLALSSSGALVAWTEADTIRVSRTVKGTFEPPIEVSSGDSASPGVALSPNGMGLAAWGVSLPGGTPVVLGTGRLSSTTEWGSEEDLGIGSSPRVALNDRGDAVVAWSLGGSGEPQGIEATTRRRGGPWQAGTVVSRRDCGCVLGVGRAAVGADGTILVGWWRDDDAGTRGGGAAAGRAGGVRWERASVVPGRTTDAPVVAATDAAGIAVWAEAGPGGGVRAATLGALRP